MKKLTIFALLSVGTSCYGQEILNATKVTDTVSVAKVSDSMRIVNYQNEIKKLKAQINQNEKTIKALLIQKSGLQYQIRNQPSTQHYGR